MSNSRYFYHQPRAGAVIWGAGPVVSFPTASQEILGTKKLSVGPTVVVLRIQGHWLFGTLVQNLFSVAGPCGARGRKSDAHAALRKLQPPTWMVSDFVTDHYCELGS